MTLISSLKEFSELVTELETIYGTLHSEMEEDERYYDLDFLDELRLPDEFHDEGVVLPTAREVVDTAADHITPAQRRVTVPRRTVDRKGTDQAIKLRTFYEALLLSYERPAASSPFRQGSKNLSRLGMVCYKQVYDENRYPDQPKRSEFDNEEEFEEAVKDWKDAKKLVIPLRLINVHPTFVFPDPWHDEPEWVVEIEEKPVGLVREDYPNWPNANGLGDLKKIKVQEFWSNTHRAVVIDGQSALKSRRQEQSDDPLDINPLIRHRWGEHPYIIQSSGLGVDDHQHRPEKKYVSMLRYIRQILESESRQYSISDIVMKDAAWPTRIAEGERSNDVPTLKTKYGEIQPMPPGVKVTTLSPALPPDLTFSHMQLSNSIISSATAPRVVRGMHQPGISSGFDRQLALGEARLRYGPLLEGMEAALSIICKKSGILLERLSKEAIHVMPYTNTDNFQVIHGKDFKNHHAVEVKINALEPEDEIRKHQDAIALVSGGLMSPQTAIRKYFPDVDPDTELGRILAARLLFSPQLMSLLSQGATTKLAEKIGLEQLLAQILQAAEEEARSKGGGNGRTPPAPESQNREQADGAGSRRDQAQGRQLDLRELGG